MAEAKTKPTAVRVEDFIDAVEPAARRDDGKALDVLFRTVTGVAPEMWGPTIVGYGRYHYRYDSGHQADMCRVAFSPRSANLVLYVGSFPEYEGLLAKLGKHKRSKACLYLNKLADVDAGVLDEIVRRTYAATEGVDRCPAC